MEVAMPLVEPVALEPRTVWARTDPWGGGHTPETDPTQRGWKFRAFSADLALFGQKGQPGCFSVMPIADGQFDVAFYDEAPAVVDAALRLPRSERKVCAQAYTRVSAVCGWALGLIAEVEKYR